MNKLLLVLSVFLLGLTAGFVIRSRFPTNILPAFIYTDDFSSTGQKSNNSNLKMPQSLCSQTEKELNDCLNNQAEMKQPQKEPYSFSTFRVYSPLFTGKEVEKIEATFKRAIIISRSLQLVDSVYIISWVLEKPSSALPHLPEYLIKKGPLDLTYDLYDFPIFDAYEFADHVAESSYISTRIPLSSSTTQTYKTSHGLLMYRKVSANCTKNPDCSSQLDFYTTADQGKTQIFVQVVAQVKKYTNDQDLTDATRNAEKVADTLSLTEY